METVEVLKAAKALIEDPARFTHRAYARNEFGTPVEPECAFAQRRCPIGALAVATKGDLEAEHRAVVFLRDAAYHLFGESHVSVISDDRGHAAAMQIYDKAIGIAEREKLAG